MKLGLKNPLNKLNVKQQMVLLFLVLVIPMFILNSYGNYKAGQILKRHVTNAYIELNKQNFRLINRDIESINKVTSTVFQNSLVQGLNPVSSEETVFTRVKSYEKLEILLGTYSQETDQREPLYYSLYVYDPENTYFFAPFYPNPKKAGVYFFSSDEKPEWFDEVVSKKGNGYLKLIEHLAPESKGQGNQSTLAYVRAINNIYKNGTIGVLVVSNMDARIGESMQTVSLPEGELYFTDWNNRILTARAPEHGPFLDLPPEADLGESMIGVKDVITNDFIYVINYNHVLQQKLIYRVPVQALLAQQNEIKRVIQLMTVVYLVVGLLIMLYFWRSLMTPLQKLVYFVRRYEPGNVVPETPHRGRKDEVSVLIFTIYDMARRLNGLIHYKYHMDLKQKESQLQILYQQINPHLLYNTLESIYWKSTMEGNTASAEMIKELSKLMKISLSRGRELITLEEELEHASAYIKLQQHRYDYLFQVSRNIPDELLSIIIPKITLQPLIENAIIHGVKHMGEDGEICISATQDEERIYIQIEDNGYKPVDYEAIDKLLNDEKHNPQFGYGIRNIQQRIRLHFGHEYGLVYAERPEGGTKVIINLPKSVQTYE
ncbi:two-component system sensor histidine kinase YesM [Paenibacillus anaericanus]|uniref:sensor histidine kinase n=1 Tax=Paenibacillus anaericanus TaxID=170367 RepID=UPI00278B459C|nr:histidine kinase [Paenibacillus anaericanus]MDQ0089181.1 two-component system sensor histidine kinase YesM [Paenibacillus anaericanus]